MDEPQAVIPGSERDATPDRATADALPGERAADRPSGGSRQRASNTPVSAGPTTHTDPSRRIRGLDMARALAIIGMVMVHFGPGRIDVDTASGFLYETSHGRASILFIVLAGVGVSLLAGDRSRARLRGTARRLLFRAVVLFPVGLLLQALGTRVAVILQYYAVFFLLALLAVRLSDRVLLGGALVSTLTAPVVYLAAWFANPSWFAPGPQPGLSQPTELLRDLLLSGYYPALTWTGPLLFGMWLGRRDLRSPVNRRRMLAGATATALVTYPLAWLATTVVATPPADAPSWRWLAVAEPHSQMPLWLIGSTAVAVAVIAASLVLADRLPRLTWPLVASGQLALTTYVGHLLLLAAAPQWFVRDTVGAATVTVARFAVVALALAALWRAVAPRGPLELLLHLPFSRPLRSSA